jgi:O-antigen/teichoic acid export membrane protein
MHLIFDLPMIRGGYGYLLNLAAGDRFQSLRAARRFIHGVFVLLTGATLAMIAPIIAAPLLTRLYSPEDYGVFALFVSVVSLLSVSIAGNYDSAVMLPKNDRDAFNLIAVCFLICLVLSIALVMVLVPFNAPVAALLGNPVIAKWLHLVPLMVFIMGLNQAFSYWANRKRQFGNLSVNKVVESVVTPIISVAMGFGRFGVSGLVLGLIAGKAAAASILGHRIWQDKKQGEVPIRRAIMLEQARRYQDFPLFAAPTSFLDVLAVQAPVLFLAKFFGPAVVGLFALAQRAIGAPLALVGVCVGQVYHQSIAEARHKNEDLTPYVFKVAGYLALIASAPVIAAALFSPALFSVVFGEQWRVAGEYASILVFPLAAKFVVSPLSTIMSVSGNVRLGSAWKLVYFFTTCTALYIASHFQVRTFLIIYSAHEIVLYAVHFLLIFKASRNIRMSLE